MKTLEELIKEFKKENCEECKINNECDGITIQFDGKLKCVKKN